MSAFGSRHVVLANGGVHPKCESNPIVLHYLENQPGQRVRIGLPRFVENVYHLPPRVLDLLEIAAYVFAADRLISRGPKDAVEYHSWARSIDFYIRVREPDFWNQNTVQDAIRDAVVFMTGDSKFSFTFQPGHTTPPTSLFDSPGFAVNPGQHGVEVTLFSGGIDSLCGSLDILKNSQSKAILVSHESQAGTTHTQRALAKALQQRFPDRVLHYRFECTLKGTRAIEETQRSRSFLYTCIAYAIASAYGKDRFNVYENGVTSINLRRREDLANARASRTTHPQSMGRMAHLLSLVHGSEVSIGLPFLFLSKGDVIRRLALDSPELLSSSVSCTRTFQTVGEATHCGCCFQCIDRRIAAYAVEAEKLDHRGLYTNDFIINPIQDPEARTTVVDYIRQAVGLSKGSLDHFQSEYLSDLAELVDYVELPGTDADKVLEIWRLLQKHGQQVHFALNRMRSHNEDVFKSLSATSLLGLISSREYLKPEVERLVGNIAEILRQGLGDMFVQHYPKDEPDLNEKLGALLRTHEEELRSEHPMASFACAGVVPDHILKQANLVIEAKYVRDKTTPSRATEGIASDQTKYPANAFILFVVYDPQHCIKSDAIFIKDIEAKGRSQVLIIR